MRGQAVVGALALLLLAAVPALPAAQGAPDTWTFMVYLAADNNLEDVGVDDFLEMATVGSTPDVNIVVQFDRSTRSNPASGGDTRYGDWTSTKRFLVAKDMTPHPANQLDDLGEVNMATPDALRDFVVWAVTNYPADHYFLDLWDHGTGWEGVILDEGSFLKTTELRDALQQVTDLTGITLDIIGNDACRMTVEIDYELRAFADYFVGSEKDEPLAGWPYDALLAELVANPSISAPELGAHLADVYVESYRDTSLYSVTLSVIEAAALPALADATALFVATMNESLPYFQAELFTARAATESYEGGVEFDLYDLAREVYNAVPSRRVKDAAGSLMAQVLRTVVYEDHWDNPSAINGYRALDAHGLSVWFPVQFNNPPYSDLNWSADTAWDAFLMTYREGTPQSLPVTANLTATDADGDGLPDGVDVRVDGVAGGRFAVDAYQGVLRTSSGEASMGSTVRLTLPEGSLIDVSIYALDAAGVLVNYTEARNALGIPFTLQGFVRDALGDPLAGVAVVVTNGLTGGTYTATTDGNGRYALAIPGGEYAAGDDLTIAASLDGETKSVALVLPSGLHELSVDLVLSRPARTEDGGVPLGVAVLLLGVEAAALLGAVVYLLRRRPPGETSRPLP